MPYEKFEQGVDPGLQAWLRMRLAAREARLKGGKETVVIKDVPYKYYKPWIASFYRLSGEEIEKIMESSDYQLWNYSIPLVPPPSSSSSSSTLEDTSARSQPKLSVKEIATLQLSSLTEEALATLVHRIMQERTIVFLEILLDHPQFLINTRIGKHRRTLLHIACGYGDVEKATLLINRKCKINIADINGLTPLHYCPHPAEEIMHSETLLLLLLQQKASINLCDNQQRSVLHYACITQSATLVLTLLQKGADMAILDNFQKFPLDYLKTGETRRMAERFLFKANRRGQYVRITARQVASSFMRDVFQVVQPKCVTCRHSMGTCTLNKQRNYRLWLFQHGRIRNEYVGSALQQVNKAAAQIVAGDPPPI